MIGPSVSDERWAAAAWPAGPWSRRAEGRDAVTVGPSRAWCSCCARPSVGAAAAGGVRLCRHAPGSGCGAWRAGGAGAAGRRPGRGAASTGCHWSGGPGTVGDRARGAGPARQVLERSPKAMAIRVLAMSRSRGGRFRSPAARSRTRHTRSVAASSEGRRPRARTARRGAAWSSTPRWRRRAARGSRCRRSAGVLGTWRMLRASGAEATGSCGTGRGSRARRTRSCTRT